MRETLNPVVGGRHAGDHTLWNQKGADSGSFLFAGMARSYNKSLILAAQIKSFSLRPSMAWVVKFTSQKL